MQIPWKEYVFTTCSTSSIFTCKWSTVQLILLPVVRLVRWHPLAVVPLLQTVRCPGPLDPAASSFLPPTNDITDTGDARNFPVCKNGAALFSRSCVCVIPQNLKAQVVIFDPKTSMGWVQGEDSPSSGIGAHARPRGVAPLLSTSDCVWNGGDMHATPKPPSVSSTFLHHGLRTDHTLLASIRGPRSIVSFPYPMQHPLLCHFHA